MSGNETKIEFKNSYTQNEKELKTFLLLEVITMDGNNYEAEVEIGCGEDLQNMMKAYFKRDWKELFYESHTNTRDICDCNVLGIRVFAKNEKGSFGYRMEKTQSGSIGLNLKEIADENANIIQGIRKLIGQ